MAPLQRRRAHAHRPRPVGSAAAYRHGFLMPQASRSRFSSLLQRSLPAPISLLRAQGRVHGAPVRAVPIGKRAVPYRGRTARQDR
ncbi:hypothetical protein IL54_2504 [Sphingobium sp. ba1]|nr:hypothetical protein IL54_2504 [Sphingobium sp. ba1]